MKITKQFNVKQLLDLFGAADQQDSASSTVGVLRDIHTALISNLTLGDNIIGAFQTVTITTSPTYTGGNFNSITLPWTFASKKAPQSVLVAQVIIPSNQSTLLSAQSVQWIYDPIKQAINIGYISGLSNNSKYTITLEVK